MLSTQRDVLFLVLLSACSLGYSANSKHSCLGTSIFSSGMLTPQRDVLFLVRVTACSFCYCGNHSHFGRVLCSYRRSALLSRYKYLLRNAYTIASTACLATPSASPPPTSSIALACRTHTFRHAFAGKALPFSCTYETPSTQQTNTPLL